MIDIRCARCEPLTSTNGQMSRCQLAAGHDGVHALMFSSDGRRHVRTWRGCDLASVTDDAVALPTLPWARGMPQPAWFTAPGPEGEHIVFDPSGAQAGEMIGG